MYSKSNGRSKWTLFLFLLAGIVLGAFLGAYLGKYPAFEWLGYGRTFGLTTPFVLSLDVLKFTFGLSFNVNIGSLIGMALGAIAYKLSDRL